VATRISRRRLALSAGPLAAGLIELGCGRRRPTGDGTSRLEASLGELREVDPALVGYYESGRIPVAPAPLYSFTRAEDDTLFVVAGTEMVTLRDGREMTRANLAGPARCLAEGPGGRLYLAVDDHIEVVDRGGSTVAVWPVADPRSILVSMVVTREAVVVADAGLKVVRLYDHYGRSLRSIGGPSAPTEHGGFVVPSPYFDLAVDRDGSLWVVNPGRHTIENWTVDGRLRSSWGRGGADLEGFCGCCNPTAMALAPNGDFVTAEKGLPRVKVYAPTGQLRAVVATPDDFADSVVGLDLAVDDEGRVLVLDPASGAIRVFEEKEA